VALKLQLKVNSFVGFSKEAVMYFYVDESGQTGLNLFDEAQPKLYYGVLSSPVDLNVTVKPYIQALRDKLKVDRLHANELGVANLTSIASKLDVIQRKNKIVFDLYEINKVDHAAINFFDQVFDQGLNKAVPWTSYWTPLRYILLLKVSYLFDLPLLKKAWSARINRDSKKANLELVEVCESLLERIDWIPDDRGREVITDGLQWAIKNPEKIHYNIYSKNEGLQISPNLVGFQAVMHGIATRLKNHKAEAISIVVDQQSQFNGAQKWISEFYRSAKGLPTASGPGLPEMDLTNIPDIPIICTPGTDNIGLEIVDVYLWLYKRYSDGKVLSDSLHALLNKQFEIGQTNEVSISGIIKRWSKFFEDLPDPEGESLRNAREMMGRDELRRKSYLSEN
jgi:hypothetical protein